MLDLCCLMYFLLVPLALYCTIKVIKWTSLKRSRSKWSKVGKDVVVLHHLARPGYGKGQGMALSISPFPPKIECWLRANGIEYVSDFNHPFSPHTKKFPWITLNGEEISDTEVIMETLVKKGLAKDFNDGLTDKEKAVSRGFRILLDDNYFISYLVERITKYRGWYLQEYMRMSSGSLMPRIISWAIIKLSMVPLLDKQIKAHGMLRLGVDSALQCGIEDLRALSNYLGSNKYLMGKEKPTEVDFALFGFLHFTLLTCHPDSILKAELENSFQNLVDYFERMKTAYFPDWLEIMADKEKNVDDLIAARKNI